jgi:hypothetical protein
MKTVSAAGAAEVREATPEEGRELFDAAAQRNLAISGKEFLCRWDRGDYMDSQDPKVSAVAVLIPFAR